MAQEGAHLHSWGAGNPRAAWLHLPAFIGHGIAAGRVHRGWQHAELEGAASDCITPQGDVQQPQAWVPHARRHDAGVVGPWQRCHTRVPLRAHQRNLQTQSELRQSTNKVCMAAEQSSRTVRGEHPNREQCTAMLCHCIAVMQRESVHAAVTAVAAHQSSLRCSRSTYLARLKSLCSLLCGQASGTVQIDRIPHQGMGCKTVAPCSCRSPGP